MRIRIKMRIQIQGEKNRPERNLLKYKVYTENVRLDCVFVFNVFLVFRVLIFLNLYKYLVHPWLLGDV